MNAETSKKDGQQPASPHPDYEVLDKVGQGKNATVYEGYDLSLNRRVAVKQFFPSFRTDPRQQELFLDEARFLAEIHHENVVQVYDVDAERGWIVMELMQGTLADQLAKGPLPPDAVRSTLQQALCALSVLHREGKLHGEIRPGKLLVDERGRVKLGTSPGSLTHGEFRLPSDSQRHVAPEILNPRQFGDPGPAADLYCLGMAALELLTGPAFEGLFTGVCRGAINKELAWVQWHSSPLEALAPVEEILPKIPPDLARVINRFVKKPAAERYASADEALHDLDERPLVPLIDPKQAAEESKRRGPGAVPIGQSPLLYRTAGAGTGTRPEVDYCNSWPACLADRRWWRHQARNPVFLCGAAVTIVACLALVGDALRRGQPPKEVDVPVTSVPAGAMLRIDHKDFGRTNCSVALRANAQYVVELELAGYEPVRQNVTVGSEPEPLDFKLTELPAPPPPVKRVLITAEPPNATIYVDKVRAGRGQASPSLKLGVHAVLVKAEGFQDGEESISVTDDDSKFHVVLLPRRYRCLLHGCPEDAAVYLDGEQLTGPPFQTQKPAGTYRLVVLHPGAVRVEKEIKIADRDVIEVVEVPQAPRIWVRVITEPPGATLSYVENGHRKSSPTPAILRLPEGLYDITLELAGHLSVQSTLPVSKEAGTFMYTLKPATPRSSVSSVANR